MILGRGECFPSYNLLSHQSINQHIPCSRNFVKTGEDTQKEDVRERKQKTAQREQNLQDDGDRGSHSSELRSGLSHSRPECSGRNFFKKVKRIFSGNYILEE